MAATIKKEKESEKKTVKKATTKKADVKKEPVKKTSAKKTTVKEDKKNSKIKVLMASSEVAPFSKVGGLADVASELPPFLEKEGCEVAVFTPLYGWIDQEKWGIVELPNSELKISMGHTEHIFKLKIEKHPKSKNINIFFVNNPK